jgi:hypothetical protein
MFYWSDSENSPLLSDVAKDIQIPNFTLGFPSKKFQLFSKKILHFEHTHFKALNAAREMFWGFYVLAAKALQ